MLLFWWYNWNWRWHWWHIFIDEKLDENILVYSMLYKYINWLKPFRIRFDEIDEFIRVYDGTRYLALFGSEKVIHMIHMKYLKNKFYYII